MIELNKDEKFVCDSGSRYRDVYTPDLKKDGTIELVVTGKEDLWELYNSFADSCDINSLIERYDAGDVSALNRGNPVFLDLLGAPKSLAEAYQMNFRAEAAFEGLPAQIREKFDNSFMKFLSDAGSPEWFDALKIEPVEVAEKEATAE